MQQHGQGIDEQQVVIEDSGRNSDRNQDPNSNSSALFATAEPPLLLAVVVSKPEEATNAKGDGSKGASPNRQDKASVIASAKKGFLAGSDSDCEECRVCQQLSEEPLIDLGCGCRGELAKAHRSCMEIWFRSRGSNKCEICQQVAVNVPLLDSQPTRCLSPLWVVFAILIGGLLLDVLVSVSLGVSALPVNIIIGVLIVLGLGTALRLALECFHEWSSRRHARGTETGVNPGYSSAGSRSRSHVRNPNQSPEATGKSQVDGCRRRRCKETPQRSRQCNANAITNTFAAATTAKSHRIILFPFAGRDNSQFRWSFGAGRLGLGRSRRGEASGLVPFCRRRLPLFLLGEQGRVFRLLLGGLPRYMASEAHP